MADPESAKQQPSKWNLLVGLKSTVDVLLAHRNSNVWSTYGGLNRIVDDLERIFRHSLKASKDFFDELNDYDIVLKNAGYLGVKYTGKTWIKDCLTQHTLLTKLTHMIENELLINEHYQESAFLRSPEYLQALFVCLQAIESNNPEVLTQLNNIMAGKEELCHGEEHKYKCSSWQEEGRQDGCLETGTYFNNYNNKDEEGGIVAPNDNLNGINVQNFYSENTRDLDNDLIENHKTFLAKERLLLRGIKLTDSKKRKHNIDKGILAQAALTVVMEGDERCTSPSSCWFEANSSVERKRSMSLTEVDFIDTESKSSPKTETPQDINRKIPNVVETTVSSSFEKKSNKGHSRSRSDGTMLIKTAKRQQSAIEVPIERKVEQNLLSESQLRLSSSLPESSVDFYQSDPLSPQEDVTSFASMLALQDLSSCELEKENAHFSISEALIQAIEQMKCDQIIASEDDDDDDDEEIQNLKLKIERRRLEKKREKLRLQPAFSNETPKTVSNPDSSASNHSTTSSSSKSSLLDVDDIGPEWEDISEECITNLSKLSASETTLVPENPHLEISSLEASASPPLSAEAVAKSLLQKFANKKHPAASELQWLVSENDAPQTLLPLPKAFSVDPEDGVTDLGEAHDQRRKSLPCRMRGNLEWAPPRFQIIFHVPPHSRRKQQMTKQNYRCVGCGMQVDPGYMKRFRYCHYLGKYFCSSCHHNSLMVIPARVISRWDFKKYEVSKFACDLLNKIHTDPLFNVKDLNPSLYQKVRTLDTIKNLRKQLYFLKSFAQTCRKSEDLQNEFSQIPSHLLNDQHLYCIQDLIQVKSGELQTYFKSLVSRSLLHINDCPLCQAKGFICEYCRNGEDIIFPFELDRVVQCSDCRASFHRDCYVYGKCPKCERIQIRKSLVAAPLPIDT